MPLFPLIDHYHISNSIQCQHHNCGRAMRFPVISRLAVLFPGSVAPEAGLKPLRYREFLMILAPGFDFYPVIPGITGTRPRVRGSRSPACCGAGRARLRRCTDQGEARLTSTTAAAGRPKITSLKFLCRSADRPLFFHCDGAKNSAVGRYTSRSSLI